MDDVAADPSHPRYQSLLLRHRLEQAEQQGLLAGSAMIAHGRRAILVVPLAQVDDGAEAIDSAGGLDQQRHHP